MSSGLFIQYPNGKITLGDNLVLGKQGVVHDIAWQCANRLMQSYQYSPADGYPGYYIMSEIARVTGGKFNNPPPPESNKNVIY